MGSAVCWGWDFPGKSLEFESGFPQGFWEFPQEFGDSLCSHSLIFLWNSLGRADHGYPDFPGRQIPVLQQLAARGRAAVRHLRPQKPQTGGAGEGEIPKKPNSHGFEGIHSDFPWIFMVLQVFLGGSISKGGAVTVVEDRELRDQPEPCVIQVRIPTFFS